MRIDRLVNNEQMNLDIASRLKAENQADDDNRAGILWFCFFPAKAAGEDGIERFFRSWGGEALYNSHEDDAETGPALKAIGIPCIIEADVPISCLAEHCYLIDKIARIYLKNRGLKTRECCDLEAYAETNIRPEAVRQVIRYPSDEFIALTGCNEWSEPL